MYCLLKQLFKKNNQQISESGLAHDKVSFLTTYHDVILGDELTDWIFDSCEVSSRSDAVNVGQFLVLNGLLSQVSVPNKSIPFEDKHNAFYRIVQLQPKEKKED